MFWVISVGLACGAGMYAIAIGCTAVLVVAAIIMRGIPNIRDPYLLTFVSSQSESIIKDINQFGKIRIRSKSSLEGDKVSTTIEFFTDEKNIQKIESIFIEKEIKFSIVKNENNYST
jgi:uncharacterized membrane protein YhiD involved in acid resistance